MRRTERDAVAEERDEDEQDVRARCSHAHLAPGELVVEVVRRAGRAVELEAADDVGPLLGREEARVRRRARQEEEGRDAEEDGEATLRTEREGGRDLVSKVALRSESSARRASRTRSRTSRKKMKRHPSFPPRPSILTMAAARRPENAPESDAAEKKSEMRVCSS